MAEGIRSNKLASMAEMSTLSNALGLNLRITSDENYQPTPDEIAQGVKVIYIQLGTKDWDGVDQAGHA